MELILERSDLRPKFAEGDKAINCSATRFCHFKVGVQRVIRAVGKAKYIELGGALYNAIYPPTIWRARSQKGRPIAPSDDHSYRPTT